MLLRKLTLHNFRNFIDTEIEFSTDPKKKFTIILGQNTYGKTTLVKSFLWILYKENIFDDKILLNKDVQNTLRPGEDKEVRGEIELDHRGFSYKIITKEYYSVDYKGTVYKKGDTITSVLKTDDEGSKPLNGSIADEEINTILRKELREYFFFDGEINKIDSVSAKKNLTEAVTNIAGLNSVEKIKEYYDPTKGESVPSYLRSELISIDDVSSAAINNELADLQEDRANAEKRINDATDEIDGTKERKGLKAQIQEFEDLLDANKDVEADQREKRRLDKDIQDNKKKKEEDFAKVISSINDANSLLKIEFAYAFLKYDLEKQLDKTSFKSQNSLKFIQEDAVDQLIKRGYCICGTKIENKNDAYKHLIAEKSHMQPNDYGRYTSDFVSAEKSNIYTANTILDNITSSADQLLTLIETIDGDVTKWKAIKDRIAGRADVGEIQNSLNEANKQLAVQEAIIKITKEETLPQIDEKIKKTNDKLLTNTQKNDKNDFIRECIAYAEDIHLRASNTIKKGRIEVRAKLEKEAGEVFNDMYHGNRELKIDDNFKAYTIVSARGKPGKLDKSTGLGTVVNYSFVAGLMKLAKDKIIEKIDDDLNDTDSQDKTYPLIMDAPFSNTDDEHIKNICNSLPNYCDQIIMFVMKKDFNYAADTIHSKVGKQYVISKVSETEAHLTEAK